LKDELLHNIRIHEDARNLAPVMRGVIFKIGRNMKKLIIFTFVFLLLRFYQSAAENPTTKAEILASPNTEEVTAQKDGKPKVSAEKTNRTLVESNSQKPIKNKEVINKTSLVSHQEKSSKVDQQNTNVRVAKATEWNAYATIAIAILTIILAIETVRLRLIQAKQIKHLSEEAIKPKIELFLDTNKYAINFLEIHIVNNGNGTANSIKFHFQAEENEAVETSKIIISKIERINFFKIGLRYLGAGQSKKSFLMSATEKELGGDENFFKSIINAQITCKDDLGKEYIYKYTFNMSEFQGIRTIGTGPTKEMADSLKKICDSLTGVVGFASGKKRFQADIFDDSSREREEKELREWMESQKKT
jgi:hypothetical protein